MIKQDIIKAREELAAKEVIERAYRFARTYKAIRETLTAMVNGQPEVIRYDINVRVPEYTFQRLKRLGIIVYEYPAYVRFYLLSTSFVKEGL